VRMADHPGRFVDQTLGYRIMMPWLVSVLPGSTQLGFEIVTVLSLALAVATLLRDAPQRAHEIPFVAALVGAGIPGLFARSEAPREGALVLTPAEVLKARRSSHPGHTRG